jgi:hypothetical protein
MNRHRLSALLGSFVLATAAAFAGSITTTFSGGNVNAIGGAVYFDLNVTTASGLTVTAIDTNVGSAAGASISGNAVAVAVYARSGTFVGAESISTGWTLVSSAAGTAAAPGQPTSFDLADFFLPFGLSGIAIVNQSYGAIYTDGDNPFVGLDLTLDPGAAVNLAFSGFPYSPRTWNGTIRYTLGKLEPVQPIQTPVPDAGATALLLAGALGGLLALRRR